MRKYRPKPTNKTGYYRFTKQRRIYASSADPVNELVEALYRLKEYDIGNINSIFFTLMSGIGILNGKQAVYEVTVTSLEPRSLTPISKKTMRLNWRELVKYLGDNLRKTFHPNELKADRHTEVDLYIEEGEYIQCTIYPEPWPKDYSEELGGYRLSFELEADYDMRNFRLVYSLYDDIVQFEVSLLK